MTDKKREPKVRRPYTRGEEIGNTLSHAVGAGLSVVATVLMLVKSVHSGSTMAVVTSVIYGASLLMLYSMSALYHGSSHPTLKKWFRVMDHCSIFLLIAGSYTPYALITLGDKGGPILLAVMWAIAIIGIILNAISVDRFHTISQVGYLAMGWAVVVLVKPLAEALPPMGLTLLVAGGLCYTVGVFFYAVKKVPYFHTIWHFFVLGGSVTHFISVYFYVLP